MNERKYAGLTTEDILAEAEEINFEPFSAIEAALSRLDELEKRNAILESAVAVRGWDEVPEQLSVELRYKYDDGKVLFLGAAYHSGVFELAPMYDEIGIEVEDCTGWRYPVGDLSE